MYTIREMVRIAKMYYELGMTQVEIAEKESLSRPTVSRILDAAVKGGIVSFVINYPLDSVSDIADEVKETFGIDKVFVSPVFVSEPSMVLQDVARALAGYLSDLVQDGDTIGISWGETLSYVADQLQPAHRRDVKIVQLNGAVSTTSFSTGAMHILEQFSKAFHSQSYMLSVPTIVDSAVIADAIMTDSSIREVLTLGQQANIAVFGIGRASYHSVLYTAGYFSEAEYGELLRQGAVGDICSRYYTIDGRLTDETLNSRTIGLQLEQLKQKEHSIAMACGEGKAEAIVGALNGKFFNTLFTDEVTAKKLLTLQQASRRKRRT